MAQIVTVKNGQTNEIEYPRTVKSALLNDDGTFLNPLTSTNIINDLTTGGETNVLSAQQGVELSSAIGQIDSNLDAHKAENMSEHMDFENRITSLASGSPKGTYATLSDLQTAFPTGNTNIYIVTADDNWYYWSGSAWTAGGVYQSSQAIDNVAQDLAQHKLDYTTQVNEWLSVLTVEGEVWEVEV